MESFLFMWHVERDESSGERSTGKVLVAADYELLDDDEALELAEAIREVACRDSYYVSEGGGRYRTREDYDAQP